MRLAAVALIWCAAAAATALAAGSAPPSLAAFAPSNPPTGSVIPAAATDTNAVVEVLCTAHAPLTPSSLAVHYLIPGTARVYSVAGLSADSGYEVKVSVPGHLPAAVRVAFTSAAAGSSDRHLLDTEKLMFRTDSRALPLGGGGSAFVRVSVDYNGVSNIDATLAVRPVPYHVVCDALTLGVLPSGAVALIAVAIIILAVAFVFGYPRLMAALNEPASSRDNTPVRDR